LKVERISMNNVQSQRDHPPMYPDDNFRYSAFEKEGTKYLKLSSGYVDRWYLIHTVTLESFF